MQLRLQSAIEQSSVASRLKAMEATLDNIAPVFDEGLRAKFDPVLTRLEIMQICLDALRLEQNAGLDALRLEQNAGLDAFRLEQNAGLDALRLEQNKHNGSVLELMGLLMARADSILQRTAIPLGRDILMRTPDGFLLLPSEDPSLVSAMWESGGRLEPGTIKVLTALLREGDYTIDVGAHIGLTVLPTARKVGPAGRVIALEPGSRALGLLRQSMALNFVGERVLLYPFAAGERHGTAQLNIGQTIGHSSLLPLPGSENTEAAEVRSVDSLVPPGQNVRLAKLDAEGFEPQVWRGMQRLITENPDLIVLVEFGPEHLRRAGISIGDWLAEFQAPGFTAYEVDEMTGDIRALKPMAELARVHSVNLLLLRQPPTAFPELNFT
jgi:FkbM family methyltransferase